MSETSAALWVEQANLTGAGIGSVAYGVHMTLFFLCFAALWKGRARSPKFAYGMLAFISGMFVLGSIGNAAQMRLVEQAYIDDRNYPGGPGAYETDYGSVLASVIGTSAYIVNSWFADGLLVYRFWVIWRASWCWLVVPLMVYLLSIISSILILVLISQPGNSLWAASSVNFALIFWSSSISLTVFLTLCIVGKLIVMRLRIRAVMGRDHKSPYTSIAAMLIESAVLDTTFALAFIITYARNSTINFLLIQVLGQVQSIAPLLIILRVAQGRGWTRATALDTGSISSPPLQFLSKSDVRTGTTVVQSAAEKGDGSRSVMTLFPTGSTVKIEQTVTRRSD